MGHVHGGLFAGLPAGGHMTWLAWRLPVLLFIVLLLGLAGCGKPPYTNISAAQVAEMQARGVPVYDIRLPEEWRETGVIEGSTPLTYFDARGAVVPDFMQAFSGRIGKNDPVVIICRSGNRSAVLAESLAALGYTRVYNAEQGMNGWRAEGRPVVPVN
jgi:rhodanese-related sulfurtransferase